MDGSIKENDMGVLLFLLGLTVGATIMAIFTKKYKFDEWYLEGQRSIIEAVKRKNGKSWDVIKDLYIHKEGE